MLGVFKLLNPFASSEEKLQYYLQHCRTTISLLRSPREKTDFVFGEMLPTLEKRFRKSESESLDLILQALDNT